MMEYIGFLISLLALIYLFFKQQSLARHRQQRPDGESHPVVLEDDTLAGLLKAMEHEAEQKSAVRAAPAAPPPAPKQPRAHRKGAASPLEQYRLESAVETRRLKSTLENRQLKPTVRERIEEPPRPMTEYVQHTDAVSFEPSRAEIAIRRLAHRRDLAIYQEIIDKPKSMRPFT